MYSTHLIKISDDLIKQTETLHALVVAVQLHVELVVVGDGGEDDAHALVRLVVQVLPTARLVTPRTTHHTSGPSDYLTNIFFCTVFLLDLVC